MTDSVSDIIDELLANPFDNEWLDEDNPQRPFDWRRRLALTADKEYREDEGAFVHRFHGYYRDPYVHQYCNLLKEFRERGYVPHKVKALFHKKYPGLFLAHNLGTQSPETLTVLIESYILAGMSDEKIAKRVPYDINTIRLYEKLFYDVRSRLPYKPFLGTFLSDQNNKTSQRAIFDQIRLASLYGGPLVADLFTIGFNDSPIVEQVESLESWVNGRFKLNLKSKGYLASGLRTLMYSDEMTKLINSVVKITELDVQDANTDVLENVQKLVEQVDFAVLDSGTLSNMPEHLRRFYETAEELRASESLRISAVV